MSFEEYKNLSNMLVLYMRNEEIRAETEPSGLYVYRYYLDIYLFQYLYFLLYRGC